MKKPQLLKVLTRASKEALEGYWKARIQYRAAFEECLVQTIYLFQVSRDDFGTPEKAMQKAIERCVPIYVEDQKGLISALLTASKEPADELYEEVREFSGDFI